jgi:undecaprenyl-diphosphatase
MISEIIVDFFQSVRPQGLKSGRFKSDPNTLLVFFILISMIPAMIVGFTLKEPIEELFLNPFFVSLMLIVTGILLFSTRFVKNPDKEMNGWRAILMGIAQSLAVIPGISRAGSTISTGLYFGVDRNIAATFSFLMVLPVLAGAMILEIKDVLEAGIESVALGGLAIGFLASFISGYIALSYLIKLLKREKFHYFAYYCWAVGIGGMIYFA